MSARNPRIVDGTGELRSLPVAASQTWSKGTPVTVVSGLVSILTDAAYPIGLAADDITTAQDANTHVNVICFVEGTRIEACMSNGASASTAVDAYLNNCYDWQAVGSTTSLIGYIDRAATATKCVRVLKLCSDAEPSRYTTADSPGFVIAEIVKLAAT